MSLLKMKKGENRSSKPNENDFFLKIKNPPFERGFLWAQLSR